MMNIVNYAKNTNWFLCSVSLFKFPTHQLCVSKIEAGNVLRDMIDQPEHIMS